MAEERAQWGSSLEFILTVIGYAVGLGNVWRFPFLVFRHGGAPFLIPFFVMLFVVGIPTFFLETALGQFTGLSPNYAFEKIAPLFQGVGYCAIIINCFIGFYYNVIIAYCIHYLLFSFRAELPWSNCPPDAIDCFKRKDLEGNRDDVCAIELQPFISKNLTIRSPSEVYFYDTVLRITDDISDLGSLNPHIVLSLLLAWFFVFAALSKGVQSLGKISYFTATFPYVILTVLVIRGCLLPGAGEGITYYVGQFNATKLGDAELWKDATVQVFYALSACSGGLVSMSSFNAFNNNLLRDALLVPILDCLTGFYAGFAVFSVLGHMFLIKCVDRFEQVAAQGPELAFVVYPEGITLMGDAASFFSILFFAMMLALGFGSEFSIMEAAMSTIIDIIKGVANTKRSVILVRLIVVIVYFIAGLSMATDGGLYVLNLIDTVIAGYPLLIVGLLQVIIIPWIYGINNFIRDIECMIGKKTKSFWLVWKISWCFLTPLALLAVIILSIALPSSGVSLKGKRYPAYAEALGWVIVATPLSAIPICAVYQIFKYRSNPKLLFKPMDEFYDRYNSILAKENKEKESVDGDDKIDQQKEGFEMVEKSHEHRDNVSSRNSVSPV